MFKQLYHFGDVQFFDLRCYTFQGSCNGAKTMSAAFALTVLEILLAVFQSSDFVVDLFDLLLIFLFFCFKPFKLGIGFVFYKTSFVCWCFQPCGCGMI